MNNFSLEQGDALELMKELPDESVDAVITDPPYNFGKSMANDSLSVEDSWLFIASYLEEFKRVIRKGSPILIFYSSGEGLATFMSAAYGRLKFKKMLFLYKPNDCTFPLSSVIRTSESLLLFSSVDGTFNYEHEEFLHDVISANVEKQGLFYHPSVKNLSAIEKIMKGFTVRGSLVLDPFMGSGTTGIAALRLGRNFIGYELDKGYFEIAKKRIESAASQTNLLEVES